MDSNHMSRTLTSARPGGASPQGARTHPEWWLRPRFINLAIGFAFAATTIIFLGLSLPRNDRISALYWFIVLPVFVVIEILLEKYMTGFETKRFWQFGGAIIAMLTVMPLAITPKCGWNNDKCPVTHNSQPAHRPAP